MIWSLTGTDSSFWQFKDTFIHSNRPVLISFLSAKIAAKRNDIAEEWIQFFIWPVNPRAWEGILKAYQWPQENTEAHFAWKDPWQKKHTRPVLLKLSCTSDLLGDLGKCPFWLSRSGSCISHMHPSASVIAGQHTPHSEYQESKQGALNSSPDAFSIFLFSKAPTPHFSNLPKLPAMNCPTSVPYYSLSIPCMGPVGASP